MTINFFWVCTWKMDFTNLFSTVIIICEILFVESGYWLRISNYLLLHKKWSLSWRISPVNVTKFGVSCGFGHSYWRNFSWKTSCFVQGVMYSLDLNYLDFDCISGNFLANISLLKIAMETPEQYVKSSKNSKIKTKEWYVFIFGFERISHIILCFHCSFWSSKIG